MLKALVYGKAGRLSEADAGASWRQVFRKYEDPLTAAIFGRFRYLAPSVQAELLGQLLTEKWSHGALLRAEFWPRLEATTGSVEPDVLFEFEEVFLLIEAKRPRTRGQSLTQWLKQIEALIRDEDLPEKRILLLALGGNENEGRITPEDPRGLLETRRVEVFRRHWTTLRDAIQEVRRANEGEDAVLEDMLEGLGLYGIRDGVPSWSQLLKLTSSPLEWTGLRMWDQGVAKGWNRSWRGFLEFAAMHRDTLGGEVWRQNFKKNAKR